MMLSRVIVFLGLSGVMVAALTWMDGGPWHESKALPQPDGRLSVAAGAGELSLEGSFRRSSPKACSVV